MQAAVLCWEAMTSYTDSPAEVWELGDVMEGHWGLGEAKAGMG